MERVFDRLEREALRRLAKTINWYEERKFKKKFLGKEYIDPFGLEKHNIYSHLGTSALSRAKRGLEWLLKEQFVFSGTVRKKEDDATFVLTDAGISALGIFDKEMRPPKRNLRPSYIRRLIRKQEQAAKIYEDIKDLQLLISRDR